MKKRKNTRKNSRKSAQRNNSSVEAKGPEINNIDVSIKAPFGPVLYEVTISPLMVEKLNTVCDIAIEEHRERWGHRLVGNIANEWLVSNELLNDNGLYTYFQNIAVMYGKTSKQQMRGIDEGLSLIHI